MRFAMSLALAAAVGLPGPALFAAADKEVDCSYQGDVVEAVRQARIARVKERMVPEHIAQTNPMWPERYNTAIPLMTPWVYEMKLRDVKNQDLAAAWKELCLSQ